MKNSIQIVMILISSFVFCQEQDLIGEWKIDLRPTPDSEGYYQTFKISQIDQNSIEGSFYGSPVEDGMLNRNWERLYLSFSTKDQNHTYYHTAYLEKGILYGITYCPGRKFTAPWKGKKK
ncbi:MAG: hypothetical protein ABF295_08530 [Flavobacteriaceae bacterium]